MIYNNIVRFDLRYLQAEDNRSFQMSTVESINIGSLKEIEIE